MLTAIVLGTIFAGGSLMACNDMSPGDLMSFLVASQTVQRSVWPYQHSFFSSFSEVSNNIEKIKTL